MQANPTPSLPHRGRGLFGGGSGGGFAVWFGGLRAIFPPFCTRWRRGRFGGGVAVVAQQLFQHGFVRPGGIKGLTARFLLVGGGSVEGVPVVGVRAVA